MRIVVAMPAYNEEQDLPGLLVRMEKALSPWADYVVLVVDDGSQDRTAAIVRDAGTRMPAELIQHEHNQGLGAAIRTAIRAAARRGDVVVTLDADNSQDPELIQTMVRRLNEGYDVVIASRFQPGAQEVGVPQYRLFLSHLSSAGIRMLARVPGARDYTCGFRAYRSETLLRLIDRYGDNFLRENGFACMLELLLNLRRIGARVTEVPLVLRYDLKVGVSKMRVVRTMWRYAVTMVRSAFPLRPRAAESSAPVSLDAR